MKRDKDTTALKAYERAPFSCQSVFGHTLLKLHLDSAVALSTQKSVKMLKSHISILRSQVWHLPAGARQLWRPANGSCYDVPHSTITSPTAVYKTGSVGLISEGTQHNGYCQIFVISKGQMWSVNLQRGSWCTCFSLFFWHFAEWGCAHQVLKMRSHKRRIQKNHSSFKMSLTTV